MTQMYCVKCKDRKDVRATEPVAFRNGTKALKGKCPTCGTVMHKITGKK